MRRFGLALLVVLVGALSVVASEAAMVTWMGIAPYEATGHFFWGAIVPMEILVVGIATLLLMRVHKANPALHMTLYALTYLGLHLVLLSVLLNPVNDLLLYVAGMSLACAIWFSLLWRFYLTR